MILTISNSQLSVSINTVGAELVSIIKNNKNYIWQIDKNFWDKTSPVLFPIVGALKDESFIYENKKYNLPRHGFARNLEFSIHQLKDNQVIFELTENQETLANYPFKFNFLIAYTVINSELVIEYFVRNMSNEILPFSLGAHPAFSIIGSLDNFSLQFNATEIFETHHLEDNLFNGKTSEIKSNKGNIKLNYDLFKNDALVFKQLKSNEVILKNRDKEILKINFDNFPYLGIWTKKKANFLCIEPWCGVADYQSHNGNFMEKEGIQLLQPKEDFLRAIRIEIY